MEDYSFDDSILAIATSLTPQALSIIRGSGKDCIKLTATVFSNAKKILASCGNRTYVGWILDGKKKIDQVVVAIYKKPKSFTGEDSVEIISHGSPYTTRAIYNLLLTKGFRAAKRGEFSFRAFLHGKINLTQSEAINLLTTSKTEKEASLAIDQLENKFFNVIENIKERALSIMSSLTVVLEYPEEDMKLDACQLKKDIKHLLDMMQGMLERWKVNKIFIDGLNVVIAGRVNAGKSSLFNELVNEERSIVSSIEGTTRDYIDADISFKGLSIKLYDTAGLRYTKDKVELEGVSRTKKIINKASLILYLIDGTQDIKDEDLFFIKSFVSPFLIVLTKNDISFPKKDLYTRLKEFGDVISISTKKKDGINALIDAIYNKVGGDRIYESDIAIISDRQYVLLEKAKDTLLAVKDQSFNFMDLMMQDMQDVLHILGEITGEIKSDEILDSIFSNFCVGK